MVVNPQQTRRLNSSSLPLVTATPCGTILVWLTVTRFPSRLTQVFNKIHVFQRTVPCHSTLVHQTRMKLEIYVLYRMVKRFNVCLHAKVSIKKIMSRPWIIWFLLKDGTTLPLTEWVTRIAKTLGHIYAVQPHQSLLMIVAPDLLCKPNTSDLFTIIAQQLTRTLTMTWLVSTIAPTV